MANFAAADLDGLARIVKRKLKRIQYRPHLIDGCLTATGLTSNPRDHMHYEFNLVKRVEAIKALPPVVAALNQTAIGRLGAMERGRKDAMPDDVNITNRP